MDAIEVLTNLDQIHGYYQPIFSADAHTVIAYEISGHLQIEGQQINLEDFVNNEDIPERVHTYYRYQKHKKYFKDIQYQLAARFLSFYAVLFHGLAS